MFCHNAEQYTVPCQYHAAVSSPYRHQAHSPRTYKFYAQTPATTGHNYPRHLSAITLGSTKFCCYHNTFDPRTIKCSSGCTFSQQITSQSKSLNYQGSTSNSAPRQTLSQCTQIKDASPSSISLPSNDYYICLHDLHDELYFIVDSASPVSLLPASIYQNQAKDHTHLTFLLATDCHPLTNMWIN